VGLTDLVVETLSAMLPVEAHRVDVYRLGPTFTGARERADVSFEVEDALALVEHADLIIAATPVFRGSYTGMFKHFFDLVDQYRAHPTRVREDRDGTVRRARTAPPPHARAVTGSAAGAPARPPTRRTRRHLP
jgi:hypothetical protein